MSPHPEPCCTRHQAEVRMHLSTLHSSRSDPGALQALYLCPECGAERRVPFDLERKSR